MTTAGYLNSKKKLEEGKLYPFRVHNMAALQDERVYFILEDPFGIRHLLPSWFYTEYGITIGQTINCFVDKINCTGRVYLEPEHPYYSRGCTYEFRLLSTQKYEKRRKSKLILADIFNAEIDVDCPDEFVRSILGLSIVECKVVRILKGRPVLVLAKKFKLTLNIK
jgi:hypothetical protein